ncbi:protein kinase [Myxococcota bacterium]|nr:protein kinase [Myxococcota bacterium]MBU1381065.1 protein kinase [Myxococcota bacterium]MBU1499124.1 protein kinase [Myxococcota bacterium]
MPIICPNCGHKYETHVKFCGICGQSIKISTAIGLPAPVTTRNLRIEEVNPDSLSNVPDSLVGQMVGEYKVTGIIGKGGMGWVYSGEHPIIGKKVAIKVLKTRYSKDNDIVQSFKNEAKAANEIRSSKIIDIFSFGQLSSGNFYFVMELLEGESLSAFLKREGKFKPSEAWVIIPQILESLEAAHDRQIIHRDLKPENIFLVKDSGGKTQVKLLDFGIAKFKEEGYSLHETVKGVIKGSPLYMSPEQCRGEDITHRSDIYSFGVILYKCFTGKEPFTGGNPLEVITGHLKDIPEPPIKHADITEDLNTLILTCLEKDPYKRPSDVKTLSENLRPLLLDFSMGTLPVRKGRNYFGAFLFLVLAAVIAVLVVVNPLKYKKKSKATDEKKPVTVPVVLEQLNVLSSHPVDLNAEYQLGFQRYMKDKFNRKVEIRWISTRDELFFLKTKIKSSMKRKENSGNVDVMLGGGQQLHRYLASEECITTEKIKSPCSVKLNLNKLILQNIPEKINGVDIIDPGRHWFGTALSSFGYVCDKEKLAKKKIKLPTEWTDLASSNLRNSIIAADPSSSSSTLMIFEMILQGLGWKDGWQTIITIGANIKDGYLKSSSAVMHKITDDPDVVCGFTIDFLYYLWKSETDIMTSQRMVFVLPKKTAAFTPDPVSVLRNAQNHDLAVNFVEYLLSEGQKIYVLPPGSENGPVKKSIPRLPVNRNLYKLKDAIFHINPFETENKSTFDQNLATKRKHLLSIMLRSAIVDNYVSLKHLGVVLKKSNLKRITIPLSEDAFLKKSEQLPGMDKINLEKLRFDWLNYFNRQYR